MKYFMLCASLPRRRRRQVLFAFFILVIVVVVVGLVKRKETDNQGIFSMTWNSGDEHSELTLEEMEGSMLNMENKSFNEVLLSRADSSRTIVLSLFDTSYADMAYNLYETSFYRFNITNYLFISADRSACRTLQNLHQRGLSVACFARFEDKDGGTSSRYGSESFRRKTHLKTIVILDALKLNLSVLIVDIDIVFFHNPLPHFSSCPKCDMQIQDDMKDTGNSGFYFVRPSSAAIHLHTKSLIVGEQRKLTNQLSLDAVLDDMLRRNKSSILIQTLDNSEFPCGNIYFEKGSVAYTPDVANCKDCVIVHNNWIVGKDAKIYRFKEIGMWQVDSDTSAPKTSTGSVAMGYYTNPQRLYLSYENSQDFGPGETLKRETNALKSALYIGHLLNRAVILPTFHCYGCVFGTQARGDCSKINRCFDQTNSHCGYKKTLNNTINRCSLNAHYHIATFNAQFMGAYREHMFLEHDKVPDSVKQHLSPLMFIESQSHGQSLNLAGNENIFNPSNLETGASRAEILSWFDKYKDVPVLRFHSLYDVIADDKFSVKSSEGDSEDKDILGRIKAGLKRSTYRQYD